MKLGVVVQRYGYEVVGGAERQALRLCERLSLRHGVRVYTTCALDYASWQNRYAPGVQNIHGVEVHRFRVEKPRNWKRFGRISRIVFLLNRVLVLPEFLEKFWLRMQGPYSPDLVRALESDQNLNDLFIFFTYLYYPTVEGLPRVSQASILVPTAHDEPALCLRIYRRLFALPRGFMFMTAEEADLVNGRFHTEKVPSEIAGYALEARKETSPGGRYLLYMGRVERGKNCHEMFDFCHRARARLIVVGPTRMDIPEGVEYRGVVSEEEKRKLLSGCQAVINPSTFESLSISVLEGWAFGKPAIVSARSPVLVGQVERSGGGYIYRDFSDFRQILKELDPERGRKGLEFVRRHYSWDTVLRKWERLFASCVS